MGGQVMKHPPEPHDKPGPDPTITLEEFRDRYTDEIRTAISDCVAVEQIRLIEYYIKVEGMEPEAAKSKSSRTMVAARRGQQLIHALHPSTYKW